MKKRKQESPWPNSDSLKERVVYLGRQMPPTGEYCQLVKQNGGESQLQLSLSPEVRYWKGIIP